MGGVLCEIQNGASFLPSLVYSLGVDPIYFYNCMGSAYAYYVNDHSVLVTTEVHLRKKQLFAEFQELHELMKNNPFYLNKINNKLVKQTSW